jgi:diguanylate cyclase (GGDEF)-like protein/PAS domain S-box-containing protein
MITPLKLLVIEDDPADYMLLERQLRQQDMLFTSCRVDSNADLNAALQQDWDAVLSDYHVPGMDCLASLARIRHHHQQLPVILVSGSIGEERAVELLRAGFSDFILKDNLLRLAPAIRRCLDDAESARARWNAEQSLIASEAKLRTYFELAPMMLSLLDDQGSIIDINSTAQETLGYDRETLLTTNVFDLVAIEDHARALHDLTSTFATGRVEGEYRMRQKSGKLFWISLRAARIDADHVLVYAKDISERKQTEERLRLMAAVFNASQEGIAITDLNGHTLAINTAFSIITEYTEDEVLGRRLNLLSSGRHGVDFYQRLWRDLSELGYWQGEIWNRRKGGEIYPQWLTISAVRNDKGEPEKYVGVFTDISRIKHSTTHIEHLAHHDALTDLPNRLLLHSRLTHSLERAHRNNTQGAVLFLDLDRFKAVNDSLGHRAGDELLQQVAQRIASRLREVDTLARLGGDEFVVVLDDIGMANQAGQVARAIIEILGEPFILGSADRVQIGCSIGICLFPQEGVGVDDLLDRADKALYQVKQSGRNAFHYYG